MNRGTYRRWLLGTTAVVALVLVGFPRNDGAAPVDVGRIRPGMTAAEVEAAVGRPPDEKQDGEEQVDCLLAPAARPEPGPRKFGYAAWRLATGRLVVRFTDGRADAATVVWNSEGPRR